MKKTMLAAEQPAETETAGATEPEGGVLVETAATLADIAGAAAEVSSVVPPGYKLVPIEAAGVGTPEALPAAAMVLDDHQAAADDGLTAVTVRLKPSVMQYVTERAAMYGETPEAHLATIVRQFRQTDVNRPDLARLPGAEPGMPAMARPR
jgi:hypothetical protein